MIPPDTTSKEQTDMSTAGSPSPGPAPADQDASKRHAVERKAGHAVKLDKLNAYYGDQHAIKDVSIEFPANQVTALIGPSGSGKSTAVRCINRMHEEIPGARAEGSVKLDELDVYDPNVDVTAVRRLIGRVFQKPKPWAILALAMLTAALWAAAAISPTTMTPSATCSARLPARRAPRGDGRAL